MELDNMMKLSEKCNIQIPLELLNLIDDGKNPDEFTRDVLNSCIAKNHITKGKLISISPEGHVRSPSYGDSKSLVLSRLKCGWALDPLNFPRELRCRLKTGSRHIRALRSI